ncbi:hypothetical protein T4E_4298 [Trichinella pseudospiralis]|uniref:Uncharacterized protein n=1 Tax=Trichinella pseudospiralis TaxID=6337 RepID=A0A0V0XNR1_TRIPS|nr:hypothetical protein T4E_4298 [Trichinella pseudospiralis]
MVSRCWYGRDKDEEKFEKKLCIHRYVVTLYLCTSRLNSIFRFLFPNIIDRTGWLLSCDRDRPADYTATLTWKYENRSFIQFCKFLSQLPGTVKAAFQRHEPSCDMKKKRIQSPNFLSKSDSTNGKRENQQWLESELKEQKLLLKRISCAVYDSVISHGKDSTKTVQWKMLLL